jgi:50S ribosomal subunit-associated GTPase HflX
MVLALNKADLVDKDTAAALEKKYSAVSITAKKRASLETLYNILDKKLDEISYLI